MEPLFGLWNQSFTKDQIGFRIFIIPYFHFFEKPVRMSVKIDEDGGDFLHIKFSYGTCKEAYYKYQLRQG